MLSKPPLFHRAWGGGALSAHIPPKYAPGNGLNDNINVILFVYVSMSVCVCARLECMRTNVSPLV